ncbi:L,D-transpeptidase family protein [Pseudophaeobacter profundi]|uniref:L,D-transpeptidase family protein n=1 Tax=Pseudophaeobacter profundi TaxID=3034152 RepID=UPI00242AFB18|nr:L,D-transpeptidase family protein [Pseudophaeobacter profundi]
MTVPPACHPGDLVLTKRGLRFAGRLLPCSIGKGGLSSDKREGDGATPIGVHHVVGLYYRPDRITCPTPWARAIGPGDLWSDDSNDARYNTHVTTPYPHSHEHLRRADPLYDLVLVLNWNWPVATSGRGSAIFIHQWRRPGYPTEGCIAFSRANLHWLAARVQLGSRVVVPDLT